MRAWGKTLEGEGATPPGARVSLGPRKTFFVLLLFWPLTGFRRRRGSSRGDANQIGVVYERPGCRGISKSRSSRNNSVHRPLWENCCGVYGHEASVWSIGDNSRFR